MTGDARWIPPHPIDIRARARLRRGRMIGDSRRLAGVAAVAVLWTMLAAAMWRSGFPLLGPRPLSWMVADPASATLFRTALIAAALLLVVFHGYVRSRHPVDGWFSVVMLGGLAGQLVAAVVPIDGGEAANRVHTVAALSLGVSLPVLMWRFAACQGAGPWRRPAWALAAVEAGACAVGILLSRRSVAPLAEIVPAAGFHLWIVTVTLATRARPQVPPVIAVSPVLTAPPSNVHAAPR